MPNYFVILVHNLNTMKKILILTTAILIFSACKKDNPEPEPTPTPTPQEPMLRVKFKMDSTQVRLDNFGNISTVPAGHGALSPLFHKISAHYLELAPTQNTQLGDGSVLYNGATTTTGGQAAIDFSQAIIVGPNELFLSIPLSSIPAGTYEWARVSLSYQNYDFPFKASSYNLTGRLSSFVGYRAYLTSFMVNQETVTVNGNKDQGYWAFETDDSALPLTIPVQEGQSTGTTVVNPIAATSPIPTGSCVVTGSFATPFTITGNETSDITLILSLSTNKSLEWTDVAGDNIFEPSAGDAIVDMGLRGLIPIIE